MTTEARRVHGYNKWQIKEEYTEADLELIMID